MAARLTVRADRNGPTHFTGTRYERTLKQAAGNSGGRINSGVKESGSFSHKFTRGGTYVIYCSIHGLRDMGLTVKVR